MSTMRFNHMELTFPKGTFTDDFKADLESFYGGVLGWNVMQTQVLKMDNYLLQPDDGQFILLAEATKHLESPGLDHLGLLMESREEVDEMLERCQRFQEKDDRIKLRTFNDLITGNVVVHAFYVKHLLPIWFDIQIIERAEGSRRPREELGVRVARSAPRKAAVRVLRRSDPESWLEQSAESVDLSATAVAAGMWMHTVGFRRAAGRRGVGGCDRRRVVLGGALQR